MSSVLITVFDGLQPAQVTPELMPNLSAFAAEGVAFGNHHPVFPSVTRINGASMVTGRYPGAHGLTANTLVVRDFDPYLAFSALEPTLTQLAEKTGRVLLAPTLADILSRHGMEYVAIGTGTSGNAYVHNPNAEVSGGATIHPEFTLPRGLNDEVIARFGAWPADAMPTTARLAHAVEIMTSYILPERRPAVALIWFSEPDHAQHAHGVGSEMGVLAVRAADAQFGRLLSWLEQSGLAADTDVMVVSDHGYSTIQGVVNLESELKAAGFPEGSEPGGVIVAPNGASALFYVRDGDLAATDRLAAWLMAQPWCGPILASDSVSGIAGTLPASLIGNDGERAPELAMSFRWDSRPNDAGFAGHAFSAGGAPGLGQHGSMSRHEMNNVLFARGPNFKRGIVVETPTGNVDVAPTVLRLLGLSARTPMDGRALEEALEGGPAPAASRWTTDVHEAERSVDGGVYRQRVSVSRMSETFYLDEGRAWLEG